MSFRRRRRFFWAAIPGGGGGGGGGGVNAVNFDGTNDSLSRAGDLTGIADGQQLLFSFWIKRGANTATHSLFDNEISADWSVQYSITSLDKFRIRLRNAATTIVWNAVSTRSILVADGWVHVVCSINFATDARKLYIADTLETLATDTYTSAATIKLEVENWTVGAAFDGSSKVNGDVAEFYFTNEFLDLSVTANRRKFIDALGKPVSLGSNGSLPTGTASLVYLGNPTVTWHTNKGSGGGFTEVGALTDAATSPSD